MDKIEAKPGEGFDGMARNRKIPRRFVVWGFVRRASLSGCDSSRDSQTGADARPLRDQSRRYGTKAAALSITTGLGAVISSAARFSSCSEIACSESVKSL